jgi:ubiquinone/menaquinone biosynthesis C-methylase UbiE
VEVKKMSESQANRRSSEGEMGHWAPIYDSLNKMLSILVGTSERTVRNMTVDLAHIQAGEKVLEVGCGTGSLTLAAKKRAGPAGEVHGIDAAPEMIRVARRKAARAGADIDFRVGLIQDIPFPDAQFDVVLASFMIFHMPEETRCKGLAEIRRVLKPGGRLLIVDFEPPSQPGRRTLATLVIGHLLGGHTMMQHTVRKLLPPMEAAGFTGVEAGPTSHWAIAFARGRAGKA